MGGPSRAPCHQSQVGRRRPTCGFSCPPIQDAPVLLLAPKGPLIQVGEGLAARDYADERKGKRRKKNRKGGRGDRVFYVAVRELARSCCISAQGSCCPLCWRWGENHKGRLGSCSQLFQPVKFREDVCSGGGCSSSTTNAKSNGEVCAQFGHRVSFYWNTGAYYMALLQQHLVWPDEAATCRCSSTRGWSLPDLIDLACVSGATIRSTLSSHLASFKSLVSR
jgi:hypothetical protein